MSTSPEQYRRAQIIGSSFKTFLVRCACGQRTFIERLVWLVFECSPCDKCGGIICDNLDVMPMPEGFAGGTPRRLEILTTLEEAEQLLERAASLINREGDRERWGQTLDIAQQAACVRGLLDQDWRVQRTRQTTSI